jgi:hypothetical protein
MLAMILGAALLAQAAATAAPCAASTTPADVASLSSEGDGPKLAVSAAMSLQMGKADAQAARSASEPCGPEPISVAGRTWTASSGDRAFVRRALGPRPDDAVAFVYPITDILAALQASSGKGPPPPTRYLLVTAQGSIDTVWKAYASPPSDDQFRHDLQDALTGRIKPALSDDLAAKKVSIYVSKPAH